MNILYIDHYAGSVSMGMEFRPYYLAREWQKKGHNVRIVTASFAHLRKNNPAVTKFFMSFDPDSFYTTIIFLLLGGVLTFCVQSSAAVMAITIIILMCFIFSYVFLFIL